ncbi:flagellar hook-associated protein FlgK [Campylobacter sp. LR286c]|uniref:flagellar hook-associated protein FlgK n=1 Tax=Campylobacter sp. LR286c TaxID=2593545 RepID=UPI001237DB17|nr:flagellar hook-associated protein FlgK [Campylobacter sp. LR286c]KAA6228483.1 flagellar hook-associated protein FlgK [Campylobacter sp. LR286c]
MGIFATLYTGVSGLKVNELQIATVGNNITNANTEFYTRQRVVQTTSGYYTTSGGVQVGTGTTAESIIRIHDELSYTKLKDATTQLEYTEYMATVLHEIAERFPDLETTGILNNLENYYTAWNDFASNPNEDATKVALANAAQTLTESINQAYNDMKAIQTRVDDEIKSTVEEINSIAEQIAAINKQIYSSEVLPTDHANELRDQRDQLELQLSKLVDAVASKTEISRDSSQDYTITEPGQQYNLSICGYSIVDGVNYHPLTLEYNDITGSYSIYYQTRDEKVRDLTEKISGGQLGAQLDLRGRSYSSTREKYDDGIIQGYLDALDTFAKTLINETNNIYASSAQHTMASDYMTGLKSDTTLMNYDKTIQAGTFDIVIYDEAGNEQVRKTITVTLKTTMEDIVSQITSNTDDNGDNNSLNDVDDYLQSVAFSYDYKTDSGFFQMVAKNGFKVAIEDNGTNFSGAFSIGGFFSGTDASTISVKSSLLSDPSTIRASVNGVDSGNDMANAIIQLQYTKINFYNEDGTIDYLTTEEYYRKLTGQIASDGENNDILNETYTTLYNSVYSEYLSITGVNTSEELTALIQYQSSYAAASKIITTVDEMLDTLLGLK